MHLYRSLIAETLKKRPVLSKQLLQALNPAAVPSSTEGNEPVTIESKDDSALGAAAAEEVIPPFKREYPLLDAQAYIQGTTLHDYQIAGISWMVSMYQLGMPMILGDQMGLGKTIQVRRLLPDDASE